LKIIDGHAHLYPDTSAQKIIDRFTDFHRMEPQSGMGKGIVDDLQEKMAQSETSYTVVANFAPVKSPLKTNEWTLTTCRRYTNLIPLVSVYPEMPLDEVKAYFDRGANGIKMHNGIQEFDPATEGLREIYRYCSDTGYPLHITAVKHQEST